MEGEERIKYIDNMENKALKKLDEAISESDCKSANEWLYLLANLNNI